MNNQPAHAPISRETIINQYLTDGVYDPRKSEKRRKYLRRKNMWRSYAAILSPIIHYYYQANINLC